MTQKIIPIESVRYANANTTYGYNLVCQYIYFLGKRILQIRIVVKICKFSISSNPDRQNNIAK